MLCQLLTSAHKDAEKPHTGEGKTTRPVRGKPTNILTENTTENTTEIIDPPNPQGETATRPFSLMLKKHWLVTTSKPTRVVAT